VFGHYFTSGHYFSSLKSIISSRRRQRRRQQHHHLSIMWCVSKLDFMIISLRATSKSNKKHSLKRVHLLRKCSFQIVDSHVIMITQWLWLVRRWSHDSQLAKDDLQRRCTRFKECFLFDFDVARSEIIIKSSFETHHIIDKWWCCCRRRWRRRGEKVGGRGKVVAVGKVVAKHVNHLSH
jgi:hypothetical protein